MKRKNETLTEIIADVIANFLINITLTVLAIIVISWFAIMVIGSIFKAIFGF